MPCITINDVYEKIEKLEEEYSEKYGCEIVEMYSDIINDLKEWLNKIIKNNK